jgi:hypothetical protein
MIATTTQFVTSAKCLWFTRVADRTRHFRHFAYGQQHRGMATEARYRLDR